MTVGQAFTTHDYDIKMNTFTFSFSSSGTGHFNLSNMDIGYDVDFVVENNPAAVGNLTNIINQQLEQKFQRVIRRKLTAVAHGKYFSHSNYYHLEQ